MSYQKQTKQNKTKRTANQILAIPLQDGYSDPLHYAMWTMQ